MSHEMDFTLVAYAADVWHLKWPNGCWATLTIHETTGIVTVSSDWGNASYRWNINATGCDTIRAFFLESDADYLMGKFASSLPLRERRQLDDDASAASLQELIIQHRRAGTLDRDQARNAWREIPFLLNVARREGGDSVPSEWEWASEWYESLRYTSSPFLKLLKATMIPAFKEAIDGPSSPEMAEYLIEQARERFAGMQTAIWSLLDPYGASGAVSSELYQGLSYVWPLERFREALHDGLTRGFWLNKGRGLIQGARPPQPGDPTASRATASAPDGDESPDVEKEKAALQAIGSAIVWRRHGFEFSVFDEDRRLAGKYWTTAVHGDDCAVIRECNGESDENRSTEFGVRDGVWSVEYNDDLEGLEDVEPICAFLNKHGLARPESIKDPA